MPQSVRAKCSSAGRLRASATSCGKPAVRGDACGVRQLLAQLTEAHERLGQEVELLSFLVDGQTSRVRMGHTVRVPVGGVDGLAYDVPSADVLDALRNELVELKVDALGTIHA
jgi:hypothetical protein